MVSMSKPWQQNKTFDLSGVLELEQKLLVSGVNLDSRFVCSGDAFVALAGSSGHGLAFVDQAVDNGAVAVLIDSEDSVDLSIAVGDSLDLPVFRVERLREKLGSVGRVVYGDCDEKMKLVGVTGTDGKTSITHFIAQILSGSDCKSAVLGTVGNGFLDQLDSSTHTTADVLQLYKKLNELHGLGARAVAMEVSSHALDQRRVAGLKFAAVALSNLGSDHLDYHGNLANYKKAKATLFDTRADQCVLNIDDAFGCELFLDRPEAVAYSASGLPNARWKATECQYAEDGIRCCIGVDGEMRELTLPVLGGFNVSNILAACAVVEVLGERPTAILDRLPDLRPVVGRAELITSGNGPKVVVDYAHTAQALSSILRTLREHFDTRIWCVFGCGGDRDRSKRADMALAAVQFADCIVVTSDNPRSEDPQSIIDDVVVAIPSSSKLHVEVDRGRAIDYALRHAGANDCVLVAGKGHEDYQILADRTVPFSDRDAVLSWQEGVA